MEALSYNSGQGIANNKFDSLHHHQFSSLGSNRHNETSNINTFKSHSYNALPDQANNILNTLRPNELKILDSKSLDGHFPQFVNKSSNKHTSYNSESPNNTTINLTPAYSFNNRPHSNNSTIKQTFTSPIINNFNHHGSVTQVEAEEFRAWSTSQTQYRPPLAQQQPTTSFQLFNSTPSIRPLNNISNEKASFTKNDNNYQTNLYASKYDNFHVFNK